MLIDETLNFDDLDVRKDPRTKEYIFSEQSFTELWAWLIFMENQVEDLKLELRDNKLATSKALRVSEQTLKQNADLIGDLSTCEDEKVDYLRQSVKYADRPNTFEVVLGGSAIAVVAIAVGIVIGVVAE